MENGKREKLEENNLLDAHITNQVDSEIVFFSLLDQEIIFVHIRLNQLKMEWTHLKSSKIGRDFIQGLCILL